MTNVWLSDNTYEVRHSITGRLIWTRTVWETNGRYYMKQVSDRTGTAKLLRNDGGVFIEIAEFAEDSYDLYDYIKKGET